MAPWFGEWDKIINASMFCYAAELAERAMYERSQGVEIYPQQDDIFRALELTAPENVRVCIIGQDPYHTPGAANGLAFSVNKGVRIPPSLRNIYREMHEDLGICIPSHGDLTSWAEKGVLLLNTTLSVEAHKPASHKSWGWERFTKYIFDCCLDLPQAIVFFLWGKHAQSLAAGINWNDYSKKIAIASAHPSPLSAYNGFFGSKPFSAANEFLENNCSCGVNWEIP